MARTAKVTVEGIEYTLHPLNVGELEQLEVILANKIGIPSKIFCLAMKRAEPTVLRPELMEPPPEEIAEVLRVLSELTGIKNANPQTGAAAA